MPKRNGVLKKTPSDIDEVIMSCYGLNNDIRASLLDAPEKERGMVEIERLVKDLCRERYQLLRHQRTIQFPYDLAITTYDLRLPGWKLKKDITEAEPCVQTSLSEIRGKCHGLQSAIEGLPIDDKIRNRSLNRLSRILACLHKKERGLLHEQQHELFLV